MRACRMHVCTSSLSMADQCKNTRYVLSTENFLPMRVFREHQPCRRHEWLKLTSLRIVLPLCINDPNLRYALPKIFDRWNRVNFVFLCFYFHSWTGFRRKLRSRHVHVVLMLLSWQGSNTDCCEYEFQRISLFSLKHMKQQIYYKLFHFIRTLHLRLTRRFYCISSNCIANFSPRERCSIVRVAPIKDKIYPLERILNEFCNKMLQSYELLATHINIKS